MLHDDQAFQPVTGYCYRDVWSFDRSLDSGDLRTMTAWPLPVKQCAEDCLSCGGLPDERRHQHTRVGASFILPTCAALIWFPTGTAFGIGVLRPS